MKTSLGLSEIRFSASKLYTLLEVKAVGVNRLVERVLNYPSLQETVRTLSIC